MDRYQLAKLVQWAAETPTGRLESRKRMQKVVFLLQCAGCPFNADYSLHYYGPYSSDVAQLTDELVQVGLLGEVASTNQVGKQFSYQLDAQATESMTAYEGSAQGRSALDELEPFADRAKQLLKEDVPSLEYAATIAYFRTKGSSWDDAFQKTCEFKRLAPESAAGKYALKLATQFVD